MEHSELRAKVETYFLGQLERGIARRSSLGPLTDEEKTRHRQSVDLLKMPNEDFWRMMGRENVRSEIKAFCESAGISDEDCKNHFWAILDEIRKAKIGSYEAMEAHAESLNHYNFSTALNSSVRAPMTTDDASRCTTRATPSQQPSGPLLSELFAQRLADAKAAGEWSPKALEDYQSWAELFIELQGDRPILTYLKADAREFKTALLSLPANRNKKPQTRGLPAKDAIEAAKEYALPTIATNTVNKALGRMQAIWKWADKQLDADVADIFGPMKLTNVTSARDEHHPFSMEQLQTIFDSPLYTGCKSKRFRTKPGSTDMSATSWYWLPLLGLWTGARLNELCQLRIEDIDDEDGIPFLKIHEGDGTQRVKFGKHRVVPLHPTLTKLGVLQYAKHQRDKGGDRLFPELKLGSSGYYSDQASKDFSNYIQSIGAKTPKTSFHSFRHNFKDACRHVGINSDLNDILLGHALPGMSGRYGDGKVPVKVLHNAVCKIRYDAVGMDHLYKEF
ncbi:site-specific integrase [Cognatishimia activa]|uniref:site-specific integrase n=1 Tax=Cognatishimia activa TaxID=1715691 RepID=UPI0022321E2C|nr:site-specific integrase [Cognatishimia activa]UZD90329.1 site-specific integrase [Cognatishimia activa]